MKIGAHYYGWYKSEKQWERQALRYYSGHQPTRGWYDNALVFGERGPALDTVRYHFELCKNNGIDFLLISQKNEDLLPYLDVASEFELQITAHCETLGKTGTHKVERKHLDRLLFDAPRLADWMLHPAWLHLEDKPAIAYYVTRQIATECLNEAVARMREAFGSCFLIGDEVWWGRPNSDRIKLFDGIYAYNMYINKGDKMDKGRVVSKGESGQAYLEMIAPYEKQYAQVARNHNVKFFPTALPGYNDRAVRYDVDHYAIPRNQGEFFQQYLQYCQELLDDEVLLVTSFNEWYEDTQLEPVICSNIEVDDERDLQQGIEYTTYENLYLDILRDFKERQASQEDKKEKSTNKLEQALLTVVDRSTDPTLLTDDQLLDACALLYYQTTILPILAADKHKKKEIQRIYHANAEEAAQRGITVKAIRHRIKEITHFFSCNRDKLWKKESKSP